MPTTLRRCCIAAILGIALVGNGLQGDDRIKELEEKLKANPNDKAVLMELGVLCYERSLTGERSAGEKAIRHLDRLISLEPGNASALAYRGSLWILQAQDSWWPPTKLSRIRRGLDLLDSAVELDKLNVSIRLLRGIACVNLGGIVERTETALEDFTVILQHPEFPEQTKQVKASVYFHGGLAYKRAFEDDTARELLRRSIEVMPDSEFAGRARRELEDLQ